jgi:hypothetical protein
MGSKASTGANVSGGSTQFAASGNATLIHEDINNTSTARYGDDIIGSTIQRDILTFSDSNDINGSTITRDIFNISESKDSLKSLDAAILNVSKMSDGSLGLASATSQRAFDIVNSSQSMVDNAAKTTIDAIREAYEVSQNTVQSAFRTAQEIVTGEAVGSTTLMSTISKNALMGAVIITIIIVLSKRG